MTDTVDQIENRVRDNVDHTVRNVRDQLDLRRHVEERPWLSLGLAIAAGVFLGSLGSDDSSQREYGYRGQAMDDYPESRNRGQAMRYYADSGDRSSNERYEGSRDYGSRIDYGSMGNRSSQGNWNRGGNSGHEQQYTPSNYNYDEDRRHRSSGGGGGGGGQIAGMLSGVAGPLRDELETIARAAVNSAIRNFRESLQENIPRFDAEYQRVRSDRDHSEHNRQDESRREDNRQDESRREDNRQERPEATQAVGGYTATTSFPAGSTAGSPSGGNYEQSGSQRSEV
ncbi:MAG: hypothetical protein HC822_22300 [Oscillochloris sp.]|nr:hypothetical protein [Oscillochloris sp.]